MLRNLAIAATSGVVLIASAVPAAADTTQSTAIADFASSVTTVAYQQPVTFTGELLEAGTNDPLPNEPVQIEFRSGGVGKFVQVATGTTGSDGRFAITTTLPSGGYALAAFAGDTGLAPGQSSPGWGIHLQAAYLPSRLVLDPVPASVPAGTPVTFSGTMQVQLDGTWQAFSDAPVTLTMEPYTSAESNVMYTTTSGADGRFSLTEPVSETSEWRVADTLNGTYREDGFPTYTSADYGRMYGVSTTSVTAFSLPSQDEAHHAYSSGMYATGTVERWNGTSWVGLAYGWVDFYYRPTGSTAWHKDYGAQTDASGNFRNIVGVHLGTANWQVRIRPAADTLTSTSTGTVTNTISDQTHFRSASISRRRSGSSINGQVTDWYSGQRSFSSLSGRTLHLYYRARGSSTWHAYRTANTGKNGFFQFSVAKSHGYYFKVVFPAQGAFKSCTSRTL